MLNSSDFIQVFIFTTNHHLKLVNSSYTCSNKYARIRFYFEHVQIVKFSGDAAHH